MPFTDEERDLLELCIQAQVAQIAFGCKITGSDSALMVKAVQKLEKIAEKVREEKVRKEVAINGKGKGNLPRLRESVPRWTEDVFLSGLNQAEAERRESRMTDYIKRSDALDSLNDEALIYNFDSVQDGDAKRYARAAQRCIARIPAADVRENKHGEWIEETDRYNHWHCSRCGYVIGVLKMDSNYCPNCGAVMDGGDDE